MQLEHVVLERYEAADFVLLPKGENRGPVLDLLAEDGIDVPKFAGRSLHRS